MQKLLKPTIQPLMPVVLLGTSVKALLLGVFSDEGFFAQVFDIPKWLPGFQLLHEGLALLTTYTIGLLGLLMAIFAARACAKQNRQLASIVAGIGDLILNTTRMNTFSLAIGTDGILLGLLFGWLVGFGFNHLPKAWVFGGTLLTTVGLRLGWTHLVQAQVSTLGAPRGAWLIWINGALGWLGVPTPIDPMMPMLTSPQDTANLKAALAHHALVNPLTIGTLYRPYAMFGGVGMTLGLIIAILLIDQRLDKRRLAWWSLPMSLVNLNLPLMLGYRIWLNPVMLIPYFSAPLASCAIVWSALKLHLINASVYQVPPTTPGPMIAWLTTNGNWPALIVALLCLLVSVFIYLPFVKKVAGGEQLD